MERKSFELIVYILNKDKKVIKLNKKEELEVKWNGSLGKAKKEVIFKKNGKDYRILVVIILEKYLLGMRNTIAKDKFLAPPNSPYEIYGGYMGEPNNSPEKDAERWDKGVKLVNEWNWGRIVIYLVMLIIIVIFTLWMFKRDKNKKKGVP